MRPLLPTCLLLLGCAGPASSLVRVDNVSPGEDCPQGGVALHTGADTDGNGVLDDEEIEETHLVCNTEAPLVPLVAVEEEPPGDHCEHGGLAVHVGVDHDADGTLDPSEIEATEYLCFPVGGPPTRIEGSYTLENTVDAAWAQQVVEITGSLTLLGPGMTELSLPALESIGGDLYLHASELESLDVPNLETLGGTLDFGGVLTHLETSLTEAGGVWVAATVLEDLQVLSGFTALGEGGLSITGSDHLTSLDGLEGLRTVEGRVGVSSHAVLTRVDALHGLTWVGGDFAVSSNPSLSQCDVDALVAAVGPANIDGTVFHHSNEPCP